MSSKTRKKPKQPHSLKGGSAEANRLAVAILEVLSGVRTPTDAAESLEISLPRYYQLEVRALEGLVAACESKKKGRQMTLQARIAQLESELAQAQAVCARQQALVRISQRAIGLKSAPAPNKKTNTAATKKRRKRRPTVRALKAVAVLKKNGRNGDSATVQSATPDRESTPAGRTTDARTQDNGATTGPASRRIRAGQAAARDHPPDTHRRTDD